MEGEAEITLMLPAVPDPWKAWEEMIDYSLSYTDREGTRQLASAGRYDKRLSLRVQKSDISVFLLFPPSGFRPAGAVYPDDMEDGGRLPLSYERGCVAEILSLCLRKGIQAECINIERLSREVKKVSKGDDWTIDRELIIEKLAYGTMSANAVKRLPLFTVSIPLPEGRWFLGNPFRPAVTSTGGTVLLEDMPPGFHTLFPEANGKGVSFQIGETGSLSY